MGSIAVLIAVSIVLMYLARKQKTWDNRKHIMAAVAAFIQTMLVLYAMYRMPWPT